MGDQHQHATAEVAPANRFGFGGDTSTQLRGTGHVPALEVALGQQRLQLQPLFARRRIQRQRSLTEPHDAARVPARLGLVRTLSQRRDSPPDEIRVGASLKFARQQGRLLEVVGLDLHEFGQAVPRPAGQPVHHAPVKLGPPRLGQGSVRDVANGDVRTIRKDRSSQLLAHDVSQDRLLQMALDRFLDQGGYRRELEHPTNDRCALEHGPLVAGQGIQPSSDQGLNALGHLDLADRFRRHPTPIALDDRAALDEHPDRLLDERKVALSPIEHLLAQLRRQALHLEKRPDKPAVWSRVSGSSWND
jgi:hypothetical protein